MSLFQMKKPTNTETQEFIQKWGLTDVGLIQKENLPTDYQFSAYTEKDLGYMWSDNKNRWVKIINPEYTQREKEISNYCLLHLLNQSKF